MLFSWRRRSESPLQRPSWPYGPPAMDLEQARYAEAWAECRRLRFYMLVGGLSLVLLLGWSVWVQRGSPSLLRSLLLVIVLPFWSIVTASLSGFRCPRCDHRFFQVYYPGPSGKLFGPWRCATCGLPYRHEPIGEKGLAPGQEEPLAWPVPAATHRVELASLPDELLSRFRASASHLWSALTWRNVRAYPGRHWRGEFNLLLSFLVNGVLVRVLFAWATALIIAQAGTPGSVTVYWTLVAALWLVFVVMTGWQMVGIWRSARNGERAVGTPFARATWIGGGGFLIVFGFISALELFSQQPRMPNPAVGETARVIEPHYLRLQADQAQLVLTGGIGDDVTAETRNWLDAHPGVRFIVLDSPGGVPDEARRLAALIGARGLAAYVPRRCAAECVTAFLGGNPRMIAPGARLGLGREAADRSGDELRWRLVNAGVATWFADDAAAKPAGTLWWPTDDELLRGKVIAAITFAPAQELAPTLPTEQP